MRLVRWPAWEFADVTGPEATILLPTTGDRWELVEMSLDCIRRQTIEDIQIFIVGDGVASSSKLKYQEWARDDSRLRFFDFPKHERRGEPYRHQLLTREATGHFVAYCCDRDLWFPHHLEELREGLQAADFAQTLVMNVSPAGKITVNRGDYAPPRERTVGKFSSAGHTLAAYHRLPEGWTLTPDSIATDRFMWQKFLSHPDVRAVTVPRTTLLYFKRGDNPGWPVDQRRDELRLWHPRTFSMEGYSRCLEELTVVTPEPLPPLPSWIETRRDAPFLRHLIQSVRWLERRGGRSWAIAAWLRKRVRAGR
jgi:hypothetical protein